MKGIKQYSFINYEQNMVGCTFVEPFAGGAGLGLSLLRHELISTLVLNDIYLPIYHFWNSVFFDNWDFVNLVAKTPITIEEWRKQKEILSNCANYSPLEQGFAFFFLNRTCFSGIVKGGPIGGIEQKGTYKLDARFNKKNLIENLEELSQYGNRVSIRNENAMEMLKRNWIAVLPNQYFYYLDPPYLKKAKGLYIESFGNAEHEELSKVLENLKHPWLLSYDDEQFIRDLYKDKACVTNYHLNHSIRNKKSKPEVIISNFSVDGVDVCSMTSQLPRP